MTKYSTEGLGSVEVKGKEEDSILIGQVIAMAALLVVIGFIFVVAVLS
jgi:hypothetical protein